MDYVISIGVDNVQGMIPLTGAAAGAEEFAEWAKSQNYNTSTFTDKGERKVLIRDISEEVSRIVDSRTCTKLIIFFAGHGFLQSPTQEIWLLSDAGKYPDESINVVSSREYARASGIPYIVFISDACRAIPSDLRFTGNGGTIFPNGNYDLEDSKLDLFFATRPGDPAYEVSSEKNRKRFGLFTEAILDILKGDCPEALSFEDGLLTMSYPNYSQLKSSSANNHFNPTHQTVKTPFIEPPLKKLLKQKCSEVKATLTQNPQIIVQSQANQPHLSIFPIGETPKRPTTVVGLGKKANREDQSFFGIVANVSNVVQSLSNNNRGFIAEQDPTIGFENEGGFTDILSSVETFERVDSQHQISFDPQSRLITNANKIFDATGKRSFETMTGFTVVGERVKDVLVYQNRVEIFKQYGGTHVRILDDLLSSALILLPNGCSIPVAVMRGYIGTLVFHKHRLLTINYTPSENNYRLYEEYRKKEEEIKFLRSFVASAANEGFEYGQIFETDRLGDGRDRRFDVGSFLRGPKYLDPSLGMYAAYAYLQAGKIEDIESVHSYMSDDNYLIPFDVAMLAGKINRSMERLASFCPMLSLGWAYRNKFESSLHPMIIKASQYLVPGLWTTFNGEGTQLLKNAVQQNIIR